MKRFQSGIFCCMSEHTYNDTPLNILFTTPKIALIFSTPKNLSQKKCRVFLGENVIILRKQPYDQCYLPRNKNRLACGLILFYIRMCKKHDFGAFDQIKKYLKDLGLKLTVFY